DMTMPDLAIPRDLATPRDLAGMGRSKVDILFMIDNSYAMDVSQAELFSRFPAFAQGLADLAAKGVFLDLQIGVVTSGYGAGATGAPGCQPSPGGQRGELVSLGAMAGAQCRPPVGASYIKYAFRPGGNDLHNLPANTTLASTLTCMASVGTSGCGF